eukprot:4231272-Pyramimonas_sp.AAC.1
MEEHGYEMNNTRIEEFGRSLVTRAKEVEHNTRGRIMRDVCNKPESLLKISRAILSLPKQDPRRRELRRQEVKERRNWERRRWRVQHPSGRRNALRVAVGRELVDITGQVQEDVSKWGKVVEDYCRHKYTDPDETPEAQLERVQKLWERGGKRAAAEYS